MIEKTEKSEKTVKTGKPGWDYFYCESLEMQIAINKKTDVLYTEDKIKYSPEECHLLKTVNYQIPLGVHILKKVFSGEIVGI